MKKLRRYALAARHLQQSIDSINAFKSMLFSPILLHTAQYYEHGSYIEAIQKQIPLYLDALRSSNSPYNNPYIPLILLIVLTTKNGSNLRRDNRAISS